MTFSFASLIWKRHLTVFKERNCGEYWNVKELTKMLNAIKTFYEIVESARSLREREGELFQAGVIELSRLFTIFIDSVCGYGHNWERS